MMYYYNIYVLLQLLTFALPFTFDHALVCLILSTHEHSLHSVLAL